MSWRTLLDIYREAVELERIQDTQPPLACPHDGEPLELVDGVWHCPWGNYQTTG